MASPPYFLQKPGDTMDYAHPIEMVNNYQVSIMRWYNHQHQTSCSQWVPASSLTCSYQYWQLFQEVPYCFLYWCYHNSSHCNGCFDSWDYQYFQLQQRSSYGLFRMPHGCGELHSAPSTRMGSNQIFLCY